MPRQVDRVSGIEFVACTKAAVLAVGRNSIYSWGLVPDYTSMDTRSSPPVEVGVLRSKRVREIKCLRDSFLICSDFVLGDSYISNVPLKGIEAGKKFTMNLQIIDSNLMFVLLPLDKIGVVSFSPAGGVSKGSADAYWDNDKHVVELKITEAGHHTVYVFCNSLQLKNSPFIYTVAHGLYSHCRGFINGETVMVNAGVSFMVLVKVFDRYDNLVTTDPEIDFSINIGGRCQVIDFEEGCYRVMVYPTAIGRHSVVLKAKERPVAITIQEFADLDTITDVRTQEFISVQVLPGLIHPPNCTVEGLNPEYIAVEPVRFTIVSRDLYGNTTWHRSKPWDITTPLCITLQDSVDYCSSYASAVSSQSCKIPIKISYETHTILDTWVTIHPGPVYLLHTIVTGEGSKSGFFLAKAAKTFTVDFYDQFCNACPCGLKVESKVALIVKPISLNRYSIEYTVEAPGNYEFALRTEQGTLEVRARYDKDPKIEQQEREEMQTLDSAKQRIAQEEIARREAENRAREEEERKRLREMREKQKALDEQARKQKQMEDEEMERRLRIVERIKAQEVTKKRGLDALKKLEEEKKQKEPKKWKRIGGGFVVPFIVDDDTSTP